jgi:hypothetical protein
VESESLTYALDYQNEAIVRRFLRRYKISIEDANDLFRETKRWLWLCANTPDGVELKINDALYMIDEMWHEFIVFTKDYSDFCTSRLGKYIHHIPVTQEERDTQDRRFHENRERYRAEREAYFYQFFGAIFDMLGRETLYRWQVMYRQKYSPEVRYAIAVAPIFDKNVAVIPESPRFAETFDTILYGPEMPRDELLSTLVNLELSMTSRWPNHRCGYYCTCSKPF